MQILQPSYLFLLSGLLLPLAIHLWNRKQGKVIGMGTLRFLKALPKEQISSIQLTQKRLLLLRFLILILPILFLAGLVLQQPLQTKFEAWVLLSPEMAKDARLNKQLTTYDQDSFKIFLSDKSLTSFPLEEDEKASNIVQADYAALLSRINHMRNKPDSLVIYTSAKLVDFSKIPINQIPMQWVQVPDTDNNTSQITAALLVKNDSLKLLQTSSTPAFSAHTWFSTARNKSGNTAGIEWQILGDTLRHDSGITVPLEKTELSILLVAKDTTANEIATIKAAFRTLNTYLGTDIKVSGINYSKYTSSSETLSKADYLFLIDPESIPENYLHGKTCIINTGNLAMQQGFYFKGKIVLPQIYLDTEADRQDASLVAYLAKCLFPQLSKTASLDNRSIDDEQLAQFTPNQNSAIMQKVNRENIVQSASFSNYFLLGACVVLIGIERWLSMVKNNG